MKNFSQLTNIAVPGLQLEFNKLLMCTHQLHLPNDPNFNTKIFHFNPFGAITTVPKGPSEGPNIRGGAGYCKFFVLMIRARGACPRVKNSFGSAQWGLVLAPKSRRV